MLMKVGCQVCCTAGKDSFVNSEKVGWPVVGSLEIRPTFQSPGGKAGRSGMSIGAKTKSSGLQSPWSMVMYLTWMSSTRKRNSLSSSWPTKACSISTLRFTVVEACGRIVGGRTRLYGTLCGRS